MRCVGQEKVARLTSKKYKSFWSELPLFSCPEKTRHKDMSEAMVRAIGVNMHANRPNLPIFAVSVLYSSCEAEKSSPS